MLGSVVASSRLHLSLVVSLTGSHTNTHTHAFSLSLPLSYTHIVPFCKPSHSFLPATHSFSLSLITCPSHLFSFILSRSLCSRSLSSISYCLFVSLSLFRSPSHLFSLSRSLVVPSLVLPLSHCLRHDTRQHLSLPPSYVHPLSHSFSLALLVSPPLSLLLSLSLTRCLLP